VVDDLLEDVKVAIRKNKHMLKIYLDEVIDNDYLLRTNFYLGRQNWLDLTNRNIFSLNIVPKKPSELCGDFKYNIIVDITLYWWQSISSPNTYGCDH
jgi:hypothetical protein